ncbi:MAG: hypothetical protein BHW06_09530 [Clostridium sp. 44_14]|nr:MAG: hypothetical protein BHW06_09530 [Clostridium sp. 44_14]
MSQGVKIRGLRKNYGNVAALKQIDLDIEHGVFGLLGKNGAGKTTLMKILSTLSEPTSGEVWIDGVSIAEKKKIREKIGYCPQELSFYPNETCEDILEYILALSGEKECESRRRKVEKVLSVVNLSDCIGKKYKTLSGGMKRRLGIAQALILDPSVLIIDEPSAGLDPEERVRLKNLIGLLAIQKTIILSTHIVSDIEDICSKIGILNKGKMIFQGDKDEMIRICDGHVWEVIFSREEWKELCKNQKDIMNEIYTVRMEKNRVVLKIIAREMRYHHAYRIKPSLEDAYIYQNLLMEEN